MARFLVTFPCYLMIGEEWEQIEQAPNGKQTRKRWLVGTMIDPDRSSPTYTDGYMNDPNGCIISTKQDDRFPKDYVFTGPIHPEWVPLDAEAERLIALAPKGIAPLGEEALPSQFSVPPPVNRPAAHVKAAPAAEEPDPLAELKAQMAQLAGQMSLIQGERDELLEQNRQMRAALADLEESEPAPTVEAPRAPLM